MYNLKRILERLNEVDNVLQMSPQEYKANVSEALREVELIQQKDIETPQEMRDVFAAVAMLGFMIPNQGELMSDHAVAYQAWQMSERMIQERANRIEARKVVQP